MSQTEAATALATEDLSIGTLTEQYSDTVAAGNIISQSPSGGQNVEPGTTVDLIVSLGQGSAPNITWISISDIGVSGYEPFNGQMSKYETTNAQYCRFLNDALASGDITVGESNIYGANGSNSGVDFVGELYYNLAGPGLTRDGATSGGAARINYNEGVFTVDSGFENHPVTYESWYGATAFVNYYGWRLPTEWEWQAVADFDGSYTYGCGTIINTSTANFDTSTHPDGTTIVGSFGIYGYGMCDMAGNVWEWTSSMYNSTSYPVIRDGTWYINEYNCQVVNRIYGLKSDTGAGLGFRVCR